MSKIKTLQHLIKNDRRGLAVAICNYLVKAGIFNQMSDESFLKMIYRIRFGRKLNLEFPQTFNEKIQWLKLYDHNPIYPNLVDKVAVKEYVADIIGEDYIIKTIAVWNSPDEIDINQLPPKFVLKCTHDSGSVIICKDKDSFDWSKANKKLSHCLKRNMFNWGREWAYKSVRPRIIAEEYLECDKEELLDYKFMCFQGEVKCSFICSNRFIKDGMHVTFFDREWNVMPFERHYPMVKEGFPKPANYEQMVSIAEKLSANIPFVRVDLFSTNNRIYFGELTLYPGNGMEEFKPDEWDYYMGDWLTLPEQL